MKKIINSILIVFYFGLFIPIFISEYYFSPIGTLGAILTVIISLIYGFLHWKVSTKPEYISSEGIFIFLSSLNVVNILLILLPFIPCLIHPTYECYGLGYIGLFFLFPIFVILAPLTLITGMSSLSKIDKKQFSILRFFIFSIIILHIILLYTGRI